MIYDTAYPAGWAIMGYCTASDGEILDEKWKLNNDVLCECIMKAKQLGKLPPNLNAVTNGDHDPPAGWEWSPIGLKP